ncbi:membrane protein [Arenicella chitinivorans]|uniref:Membrane protein n=1 Tax=Arenicella chitinivorans TaxID=1329800 RepID=A0A918RYT5_9GAMM|nr:DUF423 domain-containing protein [Arenicella chitinivorans]GHA15946.1 membrane protein [Arenicella chitinivorans]
MSDLSLKSSDSNAGFSRIILLIGAVLCLTSVALGAFGAHALEALLRANNRLSTYELANQYQFYHALGLLALGAVALNQPRSWVTLPVVLCLVVGVLIFCGSLYTLALTDASWLGAITPVGGVLLLAGWTMLLINFWRTDQRISS